MNQVRQTLTRLLREGQWATIDALLANSTSSLASIPVDDPSIPHAVTSDVIIHYAARCQAPLRIIALLSRTYSESLSSPDGAGRYPIHVACKFGATPDVVQFLIRSNPPVAGFPDNFGKLPMHHVGESYLNNYTYPLYDRDRAMLHVVKMLKTASPESVNLEDDEGINAIEYALMSDANITVINSMRRACRDDWRERSKNEELVSEAVSEAAVVQLGPRRHQDLAKDIQIMAALHRNRRDNEMKLSGTGRIHLHSSGIHRPTSRAARTA